MSKIIRGKESEFGVKCFNNACIAWYISKWQCHWNMAPVFSEYDFQCYDLHYSLNTLSCANCH